MLLVYFGTDLIATWGLNLQFGVTGVLNFAYIVDLAVGAYAYALMTLGPSSASGGFQSYFIGFKVSPALALVVAVLAGMAMGGVLSLIGLRRLRPDYQAVALLVVSIVTVTIVEADQGIVNGYPGLTLIPNPLGGFGPNGSGWGYVVLVLGLAAVGYLVMRQLTDTPFGRTLRAVRDDEVAARGIGKNVVWLRAVVQIVGGGFAALSGALLAGFIGAWSPGAWQYVETISLLSAVIVGGMGNNIGVMLGTALVPVLIQQGAQYVPSISGQPGLAEDFSWVILGVLIVVFIWFRPQGVVPERRPRYAFARGRRQPQADPPATAAPEPSAAAAAALPALRLVERRRAEPQAADRPLLEVHDLVVQFGGVRAVDHATCAVEAGQITGLIGPNGAGKSTLINAVSGFVRPSGGHVTFAGKDITAHSAERRAGVGLVRTFQLPRLFPRLSVIENLLVAVPNQRAETAVGVLGGRFYWGGEEEASLGTARELLRIFELEQKADEMAGTLSGGQQRMLEVTRALMTDPRLLLLDEPLAGLSPRWSEILEQALVQLRARGLTMVLVEHELGIVDRICDTVVVMAQGSVLATGQMAALRAQEEVQAAYVIG